MPRVRRDTVAKKKRAPPLVLLVDDSEDVRELYSEFFTYVGLRVETAIDGANALGKLRTVKPDLVVMDLAMPTLDGWTATRRIKSNPSTRHIPVVVLTGQIVSDNLTRADGAGADAVLTAMSTPSLTPSIATTPLLSFLLSVTFPVELSGGGFA
jgi:CheY-like chemotaxis protein